MGSISKAVCVTTFHENHYFCLKPGKRGVLLTSFMADISELTSFYLSGCVKLMVWGYWKFGSNSFVFSGDITEEREGRLQNTAPCQSRDNCIYSLPLVHRPKGALTSGAYMRVLSPFRSIMEIRFRAFDASPMWIILQKSCDNFKRCHLWSSAQWFNLQRI